MYNIFRYVHQDDVLPLSTPITTTSGKVLHELPIPKGTQIIASIAVYNRSSSPYFIFLQNHVLTRHLNRNEEIFDDDADIFNPDRWLRDTVPNTKSALGVYASMRMYYLTVNAFLNSARRRFTFSGGSRSCIGWQFA